MLYRLENGIVRPEPLPELELDSSGQYFGVFGPEAIPCIAGALALNEKELLECGDTTANTFETHEGTDYLNLHAFNSRLLGAPPERACVCMRKNLLVFVSKDGAALEKAILEAIPEQNASLSRILYGFMEKLTAKHVELHQNIEMEITELENALLITKKRDCVREIIALRRKLMGLKRYYEQLMNVLDAMQESEQGHFEGYEIRFRLYAGRVDRLYHSVLNLRDYVTQVRESYQAEVDISLNNIMKIFTVITAIFLPLTLIVGWYGMNLQMPEYAWVGSYPLVILLCAAVVIFCISYFKKHKWF